MPTPEHFQEERKYCIKCKKYLPESLFPKDKKRPDGLFPYCKVCFRLTRVKDTKSGKVRGRV